MLVIADLGTALKLQIQSITLIDFSPSPCINHSEISFKGQYMLTGSSLLSLKDLTMSFVDLIR